MKKLTGLIAALFIMFSASSLNIPEKDISLAVRSAFKKAFTSAKEVTWERVHGFYFASFNLNGLEVSAAYDVDGEMLGTSRRLSLEQLPLAVCLAIENTYAGYRLGKEITEITFEGQTSYYFTAENSKVKLEVKADSAGSLSVEKKKRK